YFKYDTITVTSLMPVTPPCFECTTQTAQPANKICSDLVATFKYACTDDPCHTTSPCSTPKPSCKKKRSKKPCCIKHLEEAYRKRKLKTLKKNKKSKIIKKYDSQAYCFWDHRGLVQD
ncbi:uncharacterized protein LOC113552506, partial [Rhopalosiphum maidis]|uniref:uncharacterized protein LOC113552506 n=1 Tax=Rhopalosiphum maidis TaxID=43146 RepID=UPI000F008D8D